MSYNHELNKCLKLIKEIKNPVLVIIDDKSEIMSNNKSSQIYNKYFIKDDIFNSKAKFKKEKLNSIINHCKRLGFNYKKPNSNKKMKKNDIINKLYAEFEKY